MELPSVRCSRPCSALTLKSNLWTCFVRMLVKHGVQHYGFMPETYVLPTQLSLYEEALRREVAQNNRSTWILKPAAAYCGRGIFLHRTSQSLTGEGADVLVDQILDHKGVACRYIDPPFLLDGLKSDIRLYVLVTSWHPLVVYLYDEGLARFATEPYDNRAIDRRCMHLTNYSLNKHSKNFVRNTNEEEDGAGSKWSLSAFKRRLRAEIGEARADKCWRDVDDMVTKAVIAAEPTVHESMRAYIPAAYRGEPNRQCFQVYGFDVMFDADAKPWLLEVNLDPALVPQPADRTQRLSTLALASRSPRLPVFSPPSLLPSSPSTMLPSYTPPTLLPHFLHSSPILIRQNALLT